MMIRKIGADSFCTKCAQKVVKKVKNELAQCNTKNGIKAASIYTLSTLAGFGILAACSSDKKNKEQAEPIVTPKEQVVKQEVLKPKSKLAPNGYYVVKEKDNIWNIAKALLEEEKDTKNIMDTDIDKRKENIMRLNDLKYPSDTCDVVMIHPGETLYVEPHAYISNQIENADLKEHADELGTALINSVPHK